jgi:hypothetical protein
MRYQRSLQLKCSGTCGPICVSNNGNDAKCQLSLDLCNACQYGLASCPADAVSGDCQIAQKECETQDECEAYGYCAGQEPLLAVLFPEDARLYHLKVD